MACGGTVAVGAACAAPCAPTCCAPCMTTTVQWVTKQVTCYRTEVRTRQVTETVTRLVPQTITEQQQVTVCVPVTTPQKRMITEYTRVPRVVQRQVCCCQRVPVCVTDPCTGCTRTCWQTQQITKTVACTVYDCVPVQREITVNVCTIQQQVKTVPVTRQWCASQCSSRSRAICHIASRCPWSPRCACPSACRLRRVPPRALRRAAATSAGTKTVWFCESGSVVASRWVAEFISMGSATLCFCPDQRLERFVVIAWTGSPLFPFGFPGKQNLDGIEFPPERTAEKGSHQPAGSPTGKGHVPGSGHAGGKNGINRPFALVAMR